MVDNAKKYDETSFSYGVELEWGDVDRRLQIPESLGSWEYCETDIINVNEPFKYIACDPLGIEPHFGGEINTMPTHTIKEQIEIISNIKKFFETNGNRPTPSSVSHTHVHVCVPGLINDIDALKKLTEYVYKNQEQTVAMCGKFVDSPEITKNKAKMYLKYDGGRLLPEYMKNNIINLATDLPSFIKMHCAGKDGVSMGRPFRYGINMYSLKHLGTIEFRFFRSSTDLEEIKSCLEFCKLFLLNALNDGDDVKTILGNNTFKFPEFKFNEPEYQGWLKTKYPKERGKKERKFYEI